MPVAGLLAAVCAVKLIVVLQLKDHPLVQPDVGLDTTAYVELATRVLAGDLGLAGLYYVSPLYIYFLAAVLGAADSFTAVRLVQILLGTMTVGFVFVMAREWFGRRAAWVAASLAALTGLFTFYESLILQAALDPFLTAAALVALTFALRGSEDARTDGRRHARYLLAGIAFGVATLNRPNILLAACAIAAMLAATRRVRPAAVVLAGLLAGVAPVAVRNVVVAGQWSLVSSQGGLNFYIGNGDGATGFYHQVQGIRPTIDGQAQDARRVAERAAGRALTDAETSRYFYGLAWAWMRQHPWSAVMLFARKIGYVFIAQHVALPYSYPFYAYEAGTVLRLLAVGPWLLVPLGLVGLIFAAPASRRRDYLVWASFVPAYAVAVAVFFVSERYRLPLLVPLCAGAGAAVDVVLRALAATRPAALVAPGAAFAIVFTFANWPRALHDGRWEERLRLAQRLVILGRYDEADAWTRRLEDGAPRPGLGSYGVGMQYRAAGQPGRALPHLLRARELEPGEPLVSYGLGQALLDAGRPRDAIEHLRRGFEAAIDVSLAGYDLAVALERAGDSAGAVTVVRRMRPRDEDDHEAWLKLGRLAAQLKAPDAAEPFFRRAVEMRPDLASAHKQYGLNLLVLGRHEDAVRELGEAARLDPRDAESLAHLAYGEYRLGRTGEALAHAEAALGLDPKEPMARTLASGLRKPGGVNRSSGS